MSELSITIKNQAGEVKASIMSTNEAVLEYTQAYELGDTISLGTDTINKHYIAQIDDAMYPAYIYVKKPEIIYAIPFDEKKISYSPKCFSGEKHLITIREAEEYEITSYRNLAMNVMDQHGDPGCYPHGFANVETRGESVFAARNAIDGVRANSSHGAWPYESWGINRQDDAEMTIDFGRKVEVDKIVLYTRADFPHDNWWVEATFTFSDGTSNVVSMEKSEKAHVFPMDKKVIEWVKISNLIKADDPSPFPALSQMEVYGTDYRQ